MDFYNQVSTAVQVNKSPLNDMHSHFEDRNDSSAQSQVTLV